MPGFDMHVLGPGRQEMPRGQGGGLFSKLPLPPGTLTTLWNDDEGFKKTYFNTHPGYYETGDAGHIDEEGYVFVMSRTDDIINVAGHRLSTGEMEGILSSHQDVAECQVIGAIDQLKGQSPLGFLVLKAGVNRPQHDIVKEVIQMGATRSARSPTSSTPWSWRDCPRLVPARFSAARCKRSPITRTTRSRPRSTMRPSCSRSPRPLAILRRTEQHHAPARFLIRWNGDRVPVEATAPCPCSPSVPTHPVAASRNPRRLLIRLQHWVQSIPQSRPVLVDRFHRFHR